MNDTVTQPVVSCLAPLQLISQEEAVDKQHSQSATAAAFVLEIMRGQGRKGLPEVSVSSLPPYPITHCFPVPQFDSQSTAYQ